MPARFFDNRLSQEWKGFTILRRIIIAIAIVHFSLAAVSGYRAIVQVYDVSIQRPSAVLRPGSPIAVHVSTSGRIHVDVRIELVQGSQVESLKVVVVPSNEAFFYDPRPKHVVIGANIPADVLSRFSPGAAAIRAVAEGHAQILRTPPPTMSSSEVVLTSR